MSVWFRNHRVSIDKKSGGPGLQSESELGGSKRGRGIITGRRLLLGAPLMSVALLAGACGSSSTASNSSQSSGSGATATTASGNSNAALKASLDKLTGVPTFKAPGPAFDASKLAGGKIVSIDCAPSAAPPAQTTAATVAAGKAAGLNVTVLAGGNEDIPLDTQFIDQAINLKPIAIITVGCTPPLLTVPLQAAKNAGIPVVCANYIPPVVGAPGQGCGPLAFGDAMQPASEGTVLAEEIALNGPKNAKIGFLSADEIAGSPAVEKTFKAGLAKYCPSCQLVDVQNVNPGNWVTSLTPTITSMLTAHPDLNYLIPVFDGMTPFVSAAMKSSGKASSVKVLTTQGSTGAAMTNISNGTFMADVGSSDTWVGWTAIDQAMRAALKLPPEANPAVPIRLETAASIQGEDPKSDSAIYGDSYVQGFKTLWGLG
ncbi:MAG: sugar ABC transporter substrate-binding protein [Actinomycetota bacterium]|nr:MAG: sugar ABC transporter substrate-binding protein [Actinomycetota bacterium]